MNQTLLELNKELGFATSTWEYRLLQETIGQIQSAGAYCGLLTPDVAERRGLRPASRVEWGDPPVVRLYLEPGVPTRDLLYDLMHELGHLLGERPTHGSEEREVSAWSFTELLLKSDPEAYSAGYASLCSRRNLCMGRGDLEEVF